LNRAFSSKDDLKQIPQFRQTQRSTMEQLRDLLLVANRLGLYDAADAIKNVAA
jgi:hypothetical protein